MERKVEQSAEAEGGPSLRSAYRVLFMVIGAAVALILLVLLAPFLLALIRLACYGI